MQILINIDKETLQDLYDNRYVSPHIKEALRNGIPLPEHGDLVDRDELLTSERPRGIADDVWKESHIYKLLSNAKPIIEADTEDKEQEEERV